MSIIRPLEALRDDLRFALRILRRSPAFTTVALASLALGIGANTAIFSLIDTLMLRTLPVRDPHQLVELLSVYPGDPRMNGFPWKYYERYRDQNQVFSELVGLSPARFAVAFDGREGEAVEGAYVVGRFFPALGVEASLGRVIAPPDDVIGAAGAAVAVVSWSYWKTRLGGDAAAIGRQLLVSGVPTTVIGIAPRAFTGLQVGRRTDLWVPVAMEPLVQRPSGRLNGSLGIGVIARLKPGVSREQARANMRVLDRDRVEEIAARSGDPIWRTVNLEVSPASSGFSMLRDRFGRPLLAVMAIVGVLLLIACANVAGLLLTRGVARQGEMAVRASLGAGRMRLVRQLLTESLLLSSGGCLIGLGIAYLGVNALVHVISAGRILGLERIEIQAQPDLRLFVFAATVAIVTGVLAGLPPAWHAYTSAPATTVRDVTGAGDSRTRRLFGKTLVVANVGLAVVMLSAAALFTGHLSNLRDVGNGFQRHSVLLVTLEPRGSGYNRVRLTQLYRELIARLEALPDVRSVTLSAVTPVEGPGASRFIRVDGAEEPAGSRRRVMMNWIAPRYFATFDTPWMAGRDFTFDDIGRPRIAIVNQALAARYLGSGSPLGRRVRMEGDDQPYEIVGVAGNAKYLTLYEDAPPTIYFNAFQGAIASQFALRTTGNPDRVTGAVRLAVADVLKTVTVAKVTTLADQVDASIVPERMIGSLSTLFGVLGAVLAAIGLYGLMSYTVARRIPEIGTRMALGASRGHVMRLVLQEALLLAGAGILLGSPLAAWSRPLAGRLVDGLPATGWSIAEAATLMLGVALVAAYLPARRASRIQPLDALRRL